jgi:hypothetical protein
VPAVRLATQTTNAVATAVAAETLKPDFIVVATLPATLVQVVDSLPVELVQIVGLLKQVNQE